MFSRKLVRNVLLFYDKQGGPLRVETTTMRLAVEVGAVPNSQSKVVING